VEIHNAATPFRRSITAAAANFIEDAIAVADAGPTDIHVTPSRLTDSRPFDFE
jgi:hypothetical protein